MTKVFYNKHQDANLVAVVDASFAPNPDAHSVSAAIYYFGPSYLESTVKTQPDIAASAPEAELRQVYDSAKHMAYLRGLLGDVGEKIDAAVILTDSLSSKQTVIRPTSQRYKYINVQIKFIKKMITDGKLSVEHIKRDLNTADALTKQVDEIEFKKRKKELTDKFQWKHKVTA